MRWQAQWSWSGGLLEDWLRSLTHSNGCCVRVDPLTTLLESSNVSKCELWERVEGKIRSRGSIYCLFYVVVLTWLGLVLPKGGGAWKPGHPHFAWIPLTVWRDGSCKLGHVRKSPPSSLAARNWKKWPYLRTYGIPMGCKYCVRLCSVQIVLLSRVCKSV